MCFSILGNTSVEYDLGSPKKQSAHLEVLLSALMEATAGFVFMEKRISGFELLFGDNGVDVRTR